MAKGGRRAGAGRPKGVVNKRTDRLEREMAASARAIEKALPDSFTGDAHALLMMVYKDTRQPIELRVDAAAKAIRYEKPALASTDNKTAIDLSGGVGWLPVQ